MSVTSRLGPMAIVLAACASPLPRAEREVAVAYTPPSPSVAGRAAAAAWTVALASQPGDVAPTVTARLTSRGRAAQARPAIESSVALEPDVVTEFGSLFGAGDDMSGGLGLSSAGAPTGTDSQTGIGIGRGELGKLGTGGRAPRVKVGTPIVAGPLPADVVRRLLLRDASDLAACFADQPATFDAQFVIGGTGTATAASGAGTVPSATACVLDVIKAASYPGTGAETQIKVRLSYVPGGP